MLTFEQTAAVKSQLVKVIAAEPDRERVRAALGARAGTVLNDKQVELAIRALMEGSDWQAAIVPPRATATTRVIKAVALVVLFPLMFISPGLCQYLLSRIDDRLSYGA